MSMDSSPHSQGVPLSTTQMRPPAPKVPSFSSSSGIRAPLTLDSDFDFDFSLPTKQSITSSYTSGSEYESEGFLSGEDEFAFETASERPSVTDPDDEIIENIHFVEEYVVSSPFGIDPDDEIIEQSDNFEEYDVSRPFMIDPDDEVIENCDNVEVAYINPPPRLLHVTESRPFGKPFIWDNVKKYGVSRPFVAHPDEETLGTPMEEDDEYVPHLEPENVVMGILSPSKTAMPIAQVSGDSDDDSVGSEVVEDDGFLGSVRVPTGVCMGINIAPKVKVLGIEEGEEDESEFDDTLLDSEIVEDSISCEVGNEVLGSDEEEGSVVNDAFKDFNSAEIIKPNDSDVAEEVKAESFVESKVYVLSGNFKLDGNEDVEQQTKSNERNNSNMDIDNAALKFDSMTQKNMDMRNEEENEVVKSSSVTEMKIAEVCSEIKYLVDSKPIEAEKDIGFDNESDVVVDETKDASFMGLETNVVEHLNDKMVSTVRPVEVFGRSVEGAVGSEISYCVTDEMTELKLLETEDTVTKILEKSSLPEPVESKLQVELLETDYIKLPEPYPFQEPKYCENGHSPEVTKSGVMEDGLHGNSKILEPMSTDLIVKTTDEVDFNPENLEEKEEGSISDDVEDSDSGVSYTTKQVIDELREQFGTTSLSDGESSHDNSQSIDGQMVAESDEEVNVDGESEGKGIFDSAALAALLKAATGSGSDGGNVTFTSVDGSRIFSLERPAGSSSTFQSQRPSSQPNHPNPFNPLGLIGRGESKDILNEEENKLLEKIQQIRVKFLRLVQRLGGSLEDSVAAQGLYRLVLAAGRPSSQAFDLEAAKMAAMELEAEKKDDLKFSLNILVIGKTGVGKSAIINSIFGEEKSVINAFEPGTIAVKEIVGTIDGVKVKVLDTPGLRSSLVEQSFNRRILSSIKKFTKKCSPDVVLYVDRLDSQGRDLNDLPLLKSITSSLGSAVWRNAIITLTHAASTPPDGPSGSPLSYELFVAQRSRVVQQLISYAVSDPQMSSGLMNPVSLVENHPLYKMNGNGQIVLPNGESWRTRLLILCCSMKILSETNSVVKPQEFLDYKFFGFRVPSPSLPYFLSSLLHSLAHPKLPTHQGGENVDSDIELEHMSDTEQEDDQDEYDQLPPFKPLQKSQIAQLTKEQKKAYFEEYDYRVKLLQKKQWSDEVKRFREVKKKGKDGGNDDGCTEEDGEQSPAAVAVPLPDMTLPPSFDGDNPAYRYRFLEPTSQFLSRPVLDTQGWDHDCGYDGVSMEENVAIAGRFPAVMAVQITKDKKEFNIHLDSSFSAKHGEKGSTMVGLDIQTIGKQLAYILKSETRIKNFKRNKTAAGVSFTFLGENVVSGLKLEDQIVLGKRLVLVGSTGAIRSQSDTAYGANLEVCLREKDFPIGQDQKTMGLSLVRWRGELVWGCNLQSQFLIGRNSKMVVRTGLNNKLSGQISIRTSSSEQLQIALFGLLPIAKTIFRNIFPQFSKNDSAY